MLKFNSIGNGDCLYHSFAVAFIVAFRHQELGNLLENPVFAANLAYVMNRHSPNSIVLPTNAVTLKQTLNDFLKNFKDERRNDWVGLQLALGPILRAQVIHHIENDAGVQEHVRTRLRMALHGSVAMSTEQDANLAEYFDKMPQVRAKLIEVKQMPISLEEQQTRLSDWFFANPAGWQEYLHGIHGIDKNGVYAGDIEMSVLSHLYQISFSYSFGNARRNDIRQQVHGLGSAQPYTVVLSLETSGQHWQALLPSSQISRNIINVYKPQRRRHNVAVLASYARDNKARIQVDFPCFQHHHLTEYKDIELEDYLKIFKLTQEEYVLMSPLYKAPVLKVSPPPIQPAAINQIQLIPQTVHKSPLRVDPKEMTWTGLLQTLHSGVNTAINRLSDWMFSSETPAIPNSAAVAVPASTSSSSASHASHVQPTPSPVLFSAGAISSQEIAPELKIRKRAFAEAFGAESSASSTSAAAQNSLSPTSSSTLGMDKNNR